MEHLNRTAIARHPQLSSISSFVTEDGGGHVSKKGSRTLPATMSMSQGYAQMNDMEPPCKKRSLSNVLNDESCSYYSSGAPLTTVRHILTCKERQQGSIGSSQSSSLFMSVMSACPSSSSSSDSDCRSQKSNKKPLKPPALCLRNGPGPVGLGSMHKTHCGANSGSACPPPGTDSTATRSEIRAGEVEDTEEVYASHEDDIVEDVMAYNEDDSEEDEDEADWWKIRSNSPIATLGSPRTPKISENSAVCGDFSGPRENPSQQACSTTEDRLFHNEVPKTNASDDHTFKAHNRGQGRASLLQAPLAMAPPKLSRRAERAYLPSAGLAAPPVLRKTSPGDDCSVRSLRTWNPTTPPQRTPPPAEPQHLLQEDANLRSHPAHRKSRSDGDDTLGHPVATTNTGTSSDPPRSRSSMLADLISPSSALSEYVLSVLAVPRGTPSAPLPRKPQTPNTSPFKHSEKHTPRTPPPSRCKLPSPTVQSQEGLTLPCPPSPQHSLARMQELNHPASNIVVSGSDSYTPLRAPLHTAAPASSEDINEPGSNDSSPLTCDGEEPVSTLHTSSTPRADFPLKRRLPSRRHIVMTGELVEPLSVPVMNLECAYDDAEEEDVDHAECYDTVDSVAELEKNEAEKGPSKSRWSFFSRNKKPNLKTPKMQQTKQMKQATPPMVEVPMKPLVPPKHRTPPSNPFAALLSPSRSPTAAAAGQSEKFSDINDENSKEKTNLPASPAVGNKKNTAGRGGKTLLGKVTAKTPPQKQPSPMRLPASAKSQRAKPTMVGNNTKGHGRRAPGSVTDSPARDHTPPVVRGGTPASAQAKHSSAQMPAMDSTNGASMDTMKFRSWVSKENEKAENPFQQAIGRK